MFSLIYCTDAGLNFLDVIDFYINFVMILVGFFEAFGSAWAYDIPGQLERQGKHVVYSFMTANFGAVILGCILWFGLDPDVAVWAGFVGYFLWYFAGLGITHYFIMKQLDTDTEGNWTLQSMWYEVYFGNIVSLRDRMQEVIGKVPFIWCILMKHFIPHILIILFVNLAQSKTDTGEALLGNYGSYSMQPYQILGILVVVFTLVLFAIGAIFPDLYAPLALPQNEDAKMELEKYENKTADGGAPSEKVLDEEGAPMDVVAEEINKKKEDPSDSAPVAVAVAIMLDEEGTPEGAPTDKAAAEETTGKQEDPSDEKSIEQDA